MSQRTEKTSTANPSNILPSLHYQSMIFALQLQTLFLIRSAAAASAGSGLVRMQPYVRPQADATSNRTPSQLESQSQMLVYVPRQPRLSGHGCGFRASRPSMRCVGFHESISRLGEDEACFLVSNKAPTTPTLLQSAFDSCNDSLGRIGQFSVIFGLVASRIGHFLTALFEE